ncbi:SDR family NAD(P)-dependent oxidoreductase [Paenibacillus crassostreae]|uniref:3-oxoacyl-ACP reductase n=1 Tax=Paenibacillus crassostreae TaxID=1763538 RepID=A0A167FAS5_9BACL|nr:SDR family NAD(P)-dependent oxidoreductase [Paenibacillus crassostreae]AOZ90872.1 3-oxoacyl-ACP reductase [Paenibacillus crassostreae]OAB76361.1 3-oxoacyl-ACP reductase [Paenibacillus crassostreae]
MRDFKDKVAVITGAASGIGRAIALHCAQEEMKVVLADIDEEALASVKEELLLAGVDILTLTLDVTKEEDIQRLADKTIETFGSVDMLFNNAGVESSSLLWNTPIEEWEWVLNVNLWGVIHAIRVFIPMMLEQQTKCYVINTASRVGLESGPGIGIYRVTKHALVSLSETLYHELKLVNSKIQVAVLCPGYVQTQLYNSNRNAPDNVKHIKKKVVSPMEKIIERMNKDAMLNGMDPYEIAKKTFEDIRKGTFYILPDSNSKISVQQRMEDILKDRNPTAHLPR